MRRHVLLRILLGVLLAIAAATQILATRDGFRALLSGAGAARRPFALGTTDRGIVSVEPEAAEAGLRAGDRLVAIDGRMVRGRDDYLAALQGRRAGERVDFAVERTASEGTTATVVLAPRAGGGATDWARAIALVVLLPTLSIVLGFWVALARPADRRAWLLLGLLLGFAALVTADASPWPPVLREIGTVYTLLLAGTWPLWMMLFGLDFPRPFEGARRWRWAVVAMTALLGLAAIERAVTGVVAIHDLDAAEALAQPFERFGLAVRIAGLVAVGSFFSSLGFKSGTFRDPDDRRRLRLLWLGASAAIGPLFVPVVIVMAQGHRNLSSAPAGLLIPALLALPLFPLTLAYVIVVQRALDVRVVLRLGVQYALARRGGAVLLGATGVGLALLLSRLFVRGDVGTPGRIVLGAAYVALLVGIFRTSRRFKSWVDRRFFRDAYDAEQILTDLAAHVDTIVDRRELLETVASKVGSAMHVPRLAVLAPEGSLLRTVHATGYPAGFSAELPADGAVARRLAAAGAPLGVWPDDPASWLRKEGASAAELATLRDLDARLLVPALLQGRLVGAIALAPKLSEEPFSLVDQRLLRTVASQTALALEHARLTDAVVEEARRRERLQRDVEIAREVQESLFPKDFPAVPGLDLAGACRPALGVGGDYFDMLALPDGRIGLAIADVSGKGISAALLMSALQASLRGQALHPELELAALMTHVNRLVHDASPSNRYATFFYAQYDPATRRLDFVNAGHNPPVVLRREAGALRTLRLERCGTVVGLFADSAWKPATIELALGDLLVGFTDGVSEALNGDDEEWGEERLIAALAACDGLPAAEVIPRVMAAADAFASGAPQHDDMTLIVARVGA